MAYANMIEVPQPLPAAAVYDGTMDAKTYEVIEPGQVNTTNLIRTTQNWGITVNWEMHGMLASFLNADFHLRAYLESIGPGPEMAIPGSDIIVNTLSVPLKPGNIREYTMDIPVPAATVPAGTYKLVTLLQLCAQSGGKYPIAGLVEGPVLDIFAPS